MTALTKYFKSPQYFLNPTNAIKKKASKREIRDKSITKWVFKGTFSHFLKEKVTGE